MGQFKGKHARKKWAGLRVSSWLFVCRRCLIDCRVSCVTGHEADCIQRQRGWQTMLGFWHCPTCLQSDLGQQQELPL